MGKVKVNNILSKMVKNNELLIPYRNKYLIRVFKDKSDRYNCEMFISIGGISNCKSIKDALKVAKKEIGLFEKEYLSYSDFEEWEDYKEDYSSYIVCLECGSVFVMEDWKRDYTEYECQDCGYIWRVKE